MQSLHVWLALWNSGSSQCITLTATVNHIFPAFLHGINTSRSKWTISVNERVCNTRYPDRRLIFSSLSDNWAQTLMFSLVDFEVGYCESFQCNFQISLFCFNDEKCKNEQNLMIHVENDQIVLELHWSKKYILSFDQILWFSFTPFLFVLV